MLHTNRALAEELIDSIAEKFWDKESDFLLEMYPPKPGVEKYSFLWGFGALCTMLTTYEMRTHDQTRMELLTKALHKLELYKSRTGEYVHYNSHPDRFGAGEPYYDDNAWIVLALLDAYELTGQKKYLTRAQSVTEYLYSGWSDGIGGIRWKEADCDTSNTCSSGPTAVASCKLYMLTHKKKYLTRAKRIYDWTREKLEDTDGTFFDSISEAGVVDTRKYTYNTGTMIWCGALLYGITENARYIENAARSARGAMKEFVRTDRNGKKTLPATPWFHVYLLQGLTALHEYTDMSEYLSQIEAILCNASCDGRTQENFYYPEWNAGEYTAGKYYHQGLDEFGTAECFALLIPFEENRRPLYCFLGSSVTYGCGETGKSFVEEIAARQTYRCIKEAVCGTTLCALGENSYVERLLALDPKLPIEHLIVQLSTNDTAQHMPTGSISDFKDAADFDRNTTVGAMEYIIAYARATWNCRITFFTNPPYDNEEYEKLIEQLYLLRRKWNIGVLDFYHLRDMPVPDADTLASYRSDPVHPNAQGYTWMGNELYRYLQNTRLRA